MNGDAKVPPFRTESDDWKVHLYNQERMIEQLKELIKAVGQIDNVEIKQRELIIVQQEQMTEAVNGLIEKISTANSQLEAAVSKLASTFLGVLKVPVAVVVVGAASWAYLYMEKISERTWLLMIAVSVFPWLSDGIYAVLDVIGLRKKNGNSKA